jgi:SAM-dependent methyltransferase
MRNLIRVKYLYNRFFRSRGLDSFLSSLPKGSSILDVGCGNNSPYIIKNTFPSFHYTGIDIGDYNQSKPILADNYIVTSSSNFASEIEGLAGNFDAVISSHNIEHCDDRWRTLTAMIHALKPGGMLYISFPCEKSIYFPRRKRTLNYFDDITHKGEPPSYSTIMNSMAAEDLSIIFSTSQYKPLLLRLLGFVQEPIAKYNNTILQGTWSYYGFESIIWARKPSV